MQTLPIYTAEMMSHTTGSEPALGTGELAQQFSWSVPGVAGTLHQFDCLFECEVPLVSRHLDH